LFEVNKNKAIHLVYMKERPGAGIIFYTIREGEPHYLFLQHSKSSFLDFVKGGKESGESTLQCAVREAEEETGFTPEQYSLIEGFKTAWKYTNNVNVYRHITLYLAKCDADPTLSHEHDAYMYLTYDEAKQRLPHKEQKQILEQAHLRVKRQEKAHNT